MGELQVAQASLSAASAQRQELTTSIKEAKADQRNKEQMLKAAREAQSQCETESPALLQAVHRAQAKVVEFRAGPLKTCEGAVSRRRALTNQDATEQVETPEACESIDVVKMAATELVEKVNLITLNANSA